MSYTCHVDFSLKHPINRPCHPNQIEKLGRQVNDASINKAMWGCTIPKEVFINEAVRGYTIQEKSLQTEELIQPVSSDSFPLENLE